MATPYDIEQPNNMKNVIKLGDRKVFTGSTDRINWSHVDATCAAG